MSAKIECEDDVDIYGDLPNVPCIGDTIKELEETKKVLQDEVTRLTTKLEEVTTERNALQSKNKSLGLNISTLYKTASAEIERKDKLIAELRREKDNIIFRRQKKSFDEAPKGTSDDDGGGDPQCSQDVAALEAEQTESHHPAPEIEQTESHHPAPEIEQTESSHADTDNCASNKLSSHMYVSPNTVLTVFSRRHLNSIPGNNKFISSDKPPEDISQESEVPWNLIPIANPEQHEHTNENVHSNSVQLTKEYDSVLQNESKRKRSNSENCGYLPNTRNTVNAETKSERIHTKTRESNVSSCNDMSRSMSRESLYRHSHHRDEHKPYSKYTAARYLHSENYKSRTHHRYPVSEYHSHSDRWRMNRIPRITREASLSQALRNLRSRSRSVSESRIVPRSVQNSPNRRHSKASSDGRSSVLNETSDRPSHLASKLTDNDASSSHDKMRLSANPHLEISNDVHCKPQNKFTHDTDPHFVTGATGVELEHSLQMAKIKPSVNIPISSSAGSKHRNGSTTPVNLSEHSSFKRLKRAKIVGLNTETNPSDARTTELFNNTNVQLLGEEQNQSGGVKRPLETKDTDEVQLPDSKRQVLNDITRREWYNYRDSGDCTAQKQPNLGSMNENMVGSSKVNEDTTDDIKNVDTAMMNETNKAKERVNEIGPQNIKLDDAQQTIDNAGNKTRTRSRTSIIYNSKTLNETDINAANRRITEKHFGEHIKFSFERNPSDTKRRAPGSCRPQYISQRYHERSRTPITFNSHCKRRSPSELLNKDRAGRRLSNQDEMVRTERSRSRSSERISIYREHDRYKKTGNFDERSVRYLANKVTSEEERKKHAYSRGDAKKSGYFQNYEEKEVKYKLEVDCTKQKVMQRQKVDQGVNVHKSSLLEITSDESIRNSKINYHCGQTESVSITESIRSGNKELQHGPSTLFSVDSSNLNEFFKTGISENNNNSFPTGKSDEIRRSRSDNHEKGSQALISADSTISGINKVGCEDKLIKGKELKGKNKELCTNDSQNNENSNDEKGKHPIEVEQTKVSSTKERMTNGKDEGYDRNFQKENLLENDKNETVQEENPKQQKLTDETVNIDDEKNRETQYRNNKANQNINKSITEEDVKKAAHSSDKKESKNAQDYRSKKTDGHHATDIVSEESRVNTKQASCRENIQQVRSLKKIDDNRVIKSTAQGNCQYTKEKLEVSVSSIMKEKQNSDYKDSVCESPKEIISHSSICNETNKVEKTKKTATIARSKHRKEGETVTEELKLHDTSDVKQTVYRTKKAVPEEIQNKEQCEETEEMPKCLQRHRNGQKDECVIETAQMDANNAEVMRKQKKDSTDAEKIIILETNRDDGISLPRIQSSYIDQTESPGKRSEDFTAGAITEKEKSNYKSSRSVLSKQSVLASSVPNEVSKSENEKETTIKEGLIHGVSEEYKIMNNADKRNSKHISSPENRSNEKTLPNICQNYETNTEENQQLGFSISQTYVNVKETEISRNYENLAETVQQKSVCDKNRGDGYMRITAHHEDMGDAFKSAADRVNDTAQSAVHRNKSQCKELKQVSRGHIAEWELALDENDKGRIRRSRSRSCEDGSELVRQLEKHKAIGGTDEKYIRHNTDNAECEEPKKNEYFKDEEEISGISTNHEKMMGQKEDIEEVAQRNAHNTKHRDVTRIENGNKNVQKSDKVEPEIKSCTKAQCESVRSANNVTLNEKDCNETQNVKCNEPVTGVSVSHEGSEDTAVVISHKPSDNSARLSAASSKVSPVTHLKVRARRSMEVKLEDSKSVLIVNITPPKKEVSVSVVQGVDTNTVGHNTVSETHRSVEDRDNRQDVNTSCNNDDNINCKVLSEVPQGKRTSTFHNGTVGDSATVVPELKKKNRKTKQLHETQNIHEGNTKADLNLRSKCPSVVANYFNEVNEFSKEWDFDSSSSSNSSDQNSDDSWCPKRRQNKKPRSQQNKFGVRKTGQTRRK